MARKFQATGADRLTITAPPGLALGVGSALTVSAWINVAAFGAERVIAAKWQAGNSQWQFSFASGSSDKVRLVVSDNASLTIATGATSVQIGRWYHVAATNNAASGLRVYVNGRDDTGLVTPTRSMWSAATDFVIGNDSTSIVPFEGLISGVNVWNADLTALEIFRLSLGLDPFAVRPGSLRGCWPLNDYAGSGSALDRSPYAHTLTLSGASDPRDDPRFAFEPPVWTTSASALPVRRLAFFAGQVGIGWREN